jgi:putative transposase
MSELLLQPLPKTIVANRSVRSVAWVNRGLNGEQLEAVHTSVNRGRPFGFDPWLQRIAKLLGLEFTLRGPGRPKIHRNNR